MRNVLAGPGLPESEAATVPAARTGARLRRGRRRRGRGVLFKRLATAVAKYWVCKRGPGHAAEARASAATATRRSGRWRACTEQPLLSIWEGSATIALDVLRAMARTPAALGALLDETGPGRRRRRAAGRPRRGRDARAAGPHRAGVARAQGRRGPRAGAAGLAARRHACRGGRRVLRHPPGRWRRPRLRHAAGRRGRRRDHRERHAAPVG